MAEGGQCWEIPTFQCCSPGPQFEITRGAFGCVQRHPVNKGSGELEVPKSTRTARGIRDELQHVSSPGANNDKSYQVVRPRDDQFYKHLMSSITSGSSDRAAEAQLVGRVLRQEEVTPNISTLTNDIAHELRTVFKS